MAFGGKVEDLDRLFSRDDLQHPRRIADVFDNQLAPAGSLCRRNIGPVCGVGHLVDDRDFGAKVADEVAHDRGADKAGAAGDHELNHWNSLRISKQPVSG